MHRLLLLLPALCLCSGLAIAQTPADTAKKYDYYAGVQANLLIKEILNLSNSNNQVNNPYLLVFSANSVKTGWGLNAGLGYNYNNISDVNTPADHVSTINELFFRAGPGRKVAFGKRFLAGYGFDLLVDYLQNKTTTVTVNDLISQVDSTVSESNNKTVSFGGGFQGTLSYQVTSKVLIGTEATYYFLYSKVKQNVAVADYTRIVSSGQEFVDYSNFNTETHVTDFKFTVPVAIYLILKF